MRFFATFAVSNSCESSIMNTHGIEPSTSEYDNHDAEKVICTCRPDNKGGCMIMFMLLIMVGFSIYAAIASKDIYFVFAGTLLWLIPYLLLIDDLCWQMSGEETISLTQDSLIIRRTHKIFHRKRRIRLSTIRKVERWEISLWRRLNEVPSLTGSSQWTLYISDNGLFRFKFGPNLSEEEQEEVIETIMNAVRNSNESDMITMDDK